MSFTQEFEVFMRNYQNMVFSTALRLVANRAEAEDITQDVFLKAYQHFDQIGHSPTAGGWLKTVATNLSLNHLSRYRSRWSFFSELFRGGEQDADEPTPDFASDQDLGAELEHADRHEFVERTLQSLPAAQRVPLVLYHMEDLSYEEIASRLGVSLGKIKTDIHRGRETLRKRLQKRLDPALNPRELS